MKILLRLCLLCALLGAGWASAQTLSIKAVSVHLFLTPSGTFSEDITVLPDFAAWNFRAAVPLKPIDEEFYSFLVKVRITATGPGGFKEGRAGTVSLRSIKRNKVVYSSPIADIALPEGGIVVAKFVEDQVCDPVELVVEVGRSKVTRRLNLRCGE